MGACIHVTVGQFLSRPRSGPDLLSAGPCSEKMWGPSPGTADAIFPGKNWRPFFAHHVRSLGSRPLFPACKNLPLLLWRSLFMGVSVRPNMLNMPKSAAGPVSVLYGFHILPLDPAGDFHPSDPLVCPPSKFLATSLSTNVITGNVHTEKLVNMIETLWNYFRCK